MPTPKTPPAASAFTRPAAAQSLLGYFYPIHYKAGIKVEDALRNKGAPDELSRHQVAVLWHIHSAGDGGTTMRRKDIEQSLRAWFEISGAAITKAIRSMAAEPLALVTQEEDPRSAREKIVRLTPKGEAHIAAMMQRGVAVIREIMEPMDETTIREGIKFFQAITDSVADMERDG
ncbi:MarR family winged helix-turn-helix transcriptional regulator [Pyruvatibacter mobilis]|uniref:MarR family winged helix-turn-helix transcriptional regulator n=1 Tax=Pyruvatibacter mobilis TaxID=1712261 RepID=UPI003D0B1D96